MRKIVPLALALLLALPAVRARSAAAPGADRVTLDLVVKDRKGAVVPDLKAEEVEVDENGSKRPIESLTFVKPGEAAAQAPGPGTLVSLVFGMAGTDVGDVDRNRAGSDAVNQQKRAKQAVEAFLAHQLGPDTQIGVFRLGLQLWTVQPYTRDLALVRQAVDKAASNADLSLAEPDQQARKWVGETLSQLSKGNADPAVIARAEVLGKVIREGDRLLRQQQEGSPLYFLMALAKGQATAPGRKLVLYFTGGLTVSSQLDDVFKTMQSEANRARVAFYAVDVGGLATDSEMQTAGSAVTDAARASQDQNTRMSGAVTMDDAHAADKTIDSTRTNWKQPLKEMSENTGGFATLDTNDYKKAMDRLVGDLGGYYQVTYTPVNAAWDGVFRKTLVKVSRAGTKPQNGNGYFATPPDDSGPILAYERPLLEALKATEPKQDFSINAGTFRFAPGPEGRDVYLVAELPMSKLKFTTDPKTKTYRMHFSLLAVVKDLQGKAVERVSQDYPFQGPLDKLPQLQQGNVVFKRKVVVAPGRYTVEIVAQDRDSGATSVQRMPLEVPDQPGVALSSVVVIRRMEPAGAQKPGAPEDPLRGEATRIVPSLHEPIQKATTPKLPVYVIVYPQKGEAPPQQATIEVSAAGKPEGRNAVMLPAPDPDGRIRLLVQYPIDKYGPGEHELKVAVRQGTSQAEDRLAFTLQ